MIEWEKINLRGRTNGQFKTICPACIDQRTNKKDRSLSVNLNKGLANCHYCTEFSVRDLDEEKIETQVDWKLPSQNWKNYTNLSDKLVKWFKEERGISQSTLIDCKITEEEYFQPALGKKVNNIVFNYFERDKLVNKKYRSGNKKFTQSSGTKNVFYGINSAIGQDEVWIVEGECFTKETQILTPDGWVYFDEYDGQKVAQVNKDFTTNFINPTDFIEKYYKNDLVELKSKGYYSLTTKGHNYYLTKNGKSKKITAESIYGTKSLTWSIPRVCEGVKNTGLDISDELIRFYVMISADFTIRSAGDLYASIKKQRKIDRFKSIVNKLGIRYSCNDVKNGFKSLFIHRGHGLNPFKLFPNEWIGQLSQRQIDIVLDEILYWDGNSVPKRNQIEYSSKEIHNAEFIQTLSHLSGYVSTIIPRSNKWGSWFKVSILFGKKTTSTQKSLKRNKISFNGKVYCVTVPSGMILTRTKNIITVIGNCDKLAMHEVGIKNCISVPNGANDNDDVWENCKDYLEDVKSFVIAVDQDQKGKELSEKISKRLGRWRCKTVSFKNKDANDDLIEGRDVLLESIKSTKRFPVSGTFTAKDIENDILELYRNGVPKTYFPKHSCFGNLKNIFSVMRGHLIVPTGIPSHGKSNFVEWYILNLLNDYDMKASFFSPEHTPMALHQANFIQKFWAMPFFGNEKLSEDKIHFYNNWSSEKLYLTSPEKGQTPNWDWVLEKFKEQMYSFGVDIFVIDAFNKVLFTDNGNRLQQINDVLTRLTSFAQMNDVMIFLVAHPTKMKKNDQGVYDCPTLYDVSGSADFRNQTHDGFAIYRYFGNEEYTEFINLKTKMSFQGEIGEKVQYEYHKKSGRYYERFTEPCSTPLHKMGQSYQKEEKMHDSEYITPKMSPQDVFASDDDNEVPF